MRSPSALLAALALPLGLSLALAGCTLETAAERDRREEFLPTDVLGRPAYAAQAREVERELHARLLEVTRASQERAAVIRKGLDERLVDVVVPARLATRETYLSGLRRADAAAFEATVREAYDDALERLDALYDESMEQAVAIAAAMAPVRSPLDEGPTGNDLLDRQVTAFAETLLLDLGRTELEAEGYRRTLRRVELLQVFSSFNFEGADAALGGRLLVFVGGEADDHPRADLVFRANEGVPTEDRGLAQAVRFRVMAGDTVVTDLGWRCLPAPDGRPSVVLDGRYLVAPEAGPSLVAALGSPESLTERRIIADVQTAVFDREGAVLGGADWRLEFRVSLRGSASWSVAAVEPEFNPSCDQVAALMPAPAVGD